MAYGTLEGADVFHAARGNAEWTAADAVLKGQALERASDYIEARYGHLTALEEVFAKATYIAGGYELSRPGFFSVVHHPDDTRKVLVGVDTIKWEVLKGAEPATGVLMPTSTLIDSLFARYEGAGLASGFAMFTV